MKRYIRSNTILCSLADFRKMHLNVSDEEFNNIVGLDPTTNIEKDKKGKYCDWLLRLYKNNKLDLNRKSHITDVLNLFDSYKKNLKNKDIGAYKSLEELETAVVDETNQAEVSDNRAIKNRRKANITKDAEKVYEDSNWVVYIPKTYEASCTLGSGTQWCTADSRTDKFYNEYTKRGNLYILINKKDKSDKYQFHFKSRSFMDKSDHDIDLLDFFATDENIALYEFFRTKFNKAQKADLEILDSYNDPLVTTIRESGILYYDDTISKNAMKLAKPATIVIEDVAEIPYQAFSGFSFITRVIIGNNVTSIDDYAFASCKSLTSISLPSSITSIGQDAFWNCCSLTSITIPDNVTNIGRSAFCNCKSLKSVNIPNSISIIPGGTFRSCTSLTNIIIPDSVSNIGYSAFEDCTSLRSITIPNNITEISADAFRSCTSLISITIPNSVTTIDNCAFHNCKSLKRITIPNSVTSIGWNAFSGCESLDSVTIPNSITSIIKETFYNCTSLTSITIPDSVTRIDNRVFESCESLTIHCSKNSYAYKYAQENNIPVQLI